MEVEAAQSEAHEGKEVKHPTWYMTSDEYLELLKECLQEFGDNGGHRWHPEDLSNNIEAVDSVMRRVFTFVADRDRARP